jgi:predicted AlkP superfamily pyrophosphatase or phosphodiesterase
LDRYDGGIAYEDSIIGSIVERLRARGDLERTILVVTSDHGEQFGEHGLDSHGNSLYLPLLHVPLMVRAPGRAPAGQRVRSSTLPLGGVASARRGRCWRGRGISNADWASSPKRRGRDPQLNLSWL